MADEILKHLRKATEKLTGVKLTDADMKKLKPSLRRISEGVKAMDELQMPSEVLPAALLIKSREKD